MNALLDFAGRLGAPSGGAREPMPSPVAFFRPSGGTLETPLRPSVSLIKYYKVPSRLGLNMDWHTDESSTIPCISGTGALLRPS